MFSRDSNSPLVVVFGGAGYIGSVLVPLLLEADYRVRVVDNFLFGPFGLRGLQSDKLEIVEADICDTRAVSSAMRDADSVVLLAAIVGHRVEDGDWNYTRSVNFLASTVVLDAAIEHGVSRFIFASTNSVYGVQSGIMYETGIPEPVSLYSRLKLRMEERIINARTRHFHPVSLRIATCHGLAPRMRFDIVLNSMMRDAFFKKEIHVKSSEETRALIHVNDAAQAFLSALSAHPNMISGEIFNVGNSEQDIQIGQLANMIKQQLPETKVHHLNNEPDLVSYKLSCSKIEKLLNFKATLSIEQSIEEILSAFKEGFFEEPYSFRYQNT
jgi:nucleoside-diphosphate-sugar epimerase